MQSEKTVHQSLKHLLSKFIFYDSLGIELSKAFGLTGKHNIDVTSAIQKTTHSVANCFK
jgi:hypothetical protein